MSKGRSPIFEMGIQRYSMPLKENVQTSLRFPHFLQNLLLEIEQIALILTVLLEFFIGNVKERFKDFFIPLRTQVTIKGWENTDRISNENEEKGG